MVAQANKLSYQALNTLAGDAVKNVTYTYAMNWDGTPSGITVARTADATKRLLNRQFVVDANGNPTLQKDLIIGAAHEQALLANMYGNWTQAYSYDKLGHLTEAKGPMRDLLANLDWLGNQTGAVTSATPALTDIMAPFTAGASTSKTGYTYSATTHRLNDVNVYNMGLTPAYDGNGARTGLSGAMNLGPFVFDDAQRLTSWPLSSGGPPATVTNTVDYAARRWQTVQAGSPAVTTRFWYGADGQLLAVESPQVNGCAGTGAGTVTVRSDFVYLFGRPVAVLHSSVGATAAECATNFIATNQLGTPLAVLDDAGTIASTPELSAWGHEMYQENSGIVARTDYSGAMPAPASLWAPPAHAPHAADNGDVASTALEVIGVASQKVQLTIASVACTDVVELRDGATVIMAWAQANSYITPAQTAERLTLAIKADSTKCGGSCVCDNAASTSTSLAVSQILTDFSTRSVPVKIGLPGMYRDTAYQANNWHRQYDSMFAGGYTQVEPMARSRGAALAFAELGWSAASYGYANGNPTRTVDLDGLAPGDLFPSREAAAADAAREIVRQHGLGGNEWGGWIREVRWKTYTYQTADFVEGDSDHAIDYQKLLAQKSDPSHGDPLQCVAVVHSHPGKRGWLSDQLSGNDDALASAMRIPVFMIGPSGRLKVSVGTNPSTGDAADQGLGVVSPSGSPRQMFPNPWTGGGK